MDERLYNSSVKEEYLATFNNGTDTATTIKHLLYKATPIEKVLNEDLYNFNINQIGNVISNTDPLNVNVAINNGRFLSSYITWAIEKGLRTSNINPLKGIDEEWYKQFVGEKKLFITENGLLELESKLVNYQDKVIFRLLFEGIFGHEMSELVNLKEQDVNFETGELQLSIVDDYKGKVRDTITVSKHCINIIKGALTEKEYRNKNGLATRNPETPLVENDYVIRPVDRKVSDLTAPADRFVIYRRIKVIAELFEMSYLTAKSVHKSGMIKMGKDLYLRDGKLDKDQIYEIGDKFGLRRIQQGEHSFHNRTAIERDVNRENILALYGIDIAK